MFDLDEDDDRLLSIDELKKGTEQNQAIQALLHDLDFPENFTFEELHRMLDVDGSGMVSSQEFINGMIRLIHNTDFRRDCTFQSMISLILQNQREQQKELIQYLRALSISCQPEFHEPRKTLVEDANEKVTHSLDMLRQNMFSLDHIVEEMIKIVPARQQTSFCNRYSSISVSTATPRRNRTSVESVVSTASAPETADCIVSEIFRLGKNISGESMQPKIGRSIPRESRDDLLETPREFTPLSSGWTCTLVPLEDYLKFPLTSPRHAPPPPFSTLGVTARPRTPSTTPRDLAGDQKYKA